MNGFNFNVYNYIVPLKCAETCFECKGEEEEEEETQLDLKIFLRNSQLCWNVLLDPRVNQNLCFS